MIPVSNVVIVCDFSGEHVRILGDKRPRRQDVPADLGHPEQCHQVRQPQRQLQISYP